MPYNIKRIVRSIAGMLLPPGYDSVEDRGRKRLFVLFLFLIILPMTLFGIIHLKNGAYHFGVIDISIAAVLCCVIAVHRFLKNPLCIYRFVIIMLICLLLYWIKTVAVAGYASIWVLTFPLFAFFMTGRREGLFWTGIMAGSTVFLFINPFSLDSVWDYSSKYASRHLISMLMITLFTYLYESMGEKFKDTIENERSLLLTEKERLAAAKTVVEEMNLRLTDEMVVRRSTEEELRRHRDNLEDLVVERTRELRRYTLELEKSESRYRLLADNISDMIWSLDLHFKPLYVSPSVYEMYGYTVEEALTLPVEAIHTADAMKKVRRIYEEQMKIEALPHAERDRYIVLQLKHRRKDGSLFDVEIRVSFVRDESGRPIGLVGVTRDVSDRVRALREKEKIQEQLAQSQKMEAVGTLAGGLAHDFNNILTGILGSFDLLGLMMKNEKLAEREKIERYIAMGIESSKRSVDIIRDLLALSRKQAVRQAPVDINDAVNHTLDICKNSLPKSIVLDFKTSPDRPVIMGDMGQIGQVLLNLCINASHAMTIMRGPGEAEGGVLSVRVDTTGPDSPVDKEEGDERVLKSWVRIRISDTGVGMDSDTIPRIFDPFFTKKAPDTGSGLGLAISYNIIKNHKGIVRVYSEPGKGSLFTLFFPLSESSSLRQSIVGDAADVVRGTGTILVIDDEQMVLNITRGFLEQTGYSVVTANTPAEGISIFRERHAEISAVIIDLSMQGMSGIDVFRELKAIDPGVRAVLSSGMLDDEAKERAQDAGIREFANKPYLARELSVIVRRVLE